MRYLVVSIFQGEENNSNAHTFCVGPFEDELLPAWECMSAAAGFKRLLRLGVDSLNEKHGLYDSPEQLMVAFANIPLSVTALEPSVSMRELMAEVERWLRKQPIAA